MMDRASPSQRPRCRAWSSMHGPAAAALLLRREEDQIDQRARAEGRPQESVTTPRRARPARSGGPAPAWDSLGRRRRRACTAGHVTGREILGRQITRTFFCVFPRSRSTPAASPAGRTDHAAHARARPGLPSCGGFWSPAAGQPAPAFCHAPIPGLATNLHGSSS